MKNMLFIIMITITGVVSAPIIRDTTQNVIINSVSTLVSTGTALPAPLLRIYDDDNNVIATCAIGTFSTGVSGFSYATAANATSVVGTPDSYDIINRNSIVVLSGDISDVPYTLIDGVFHVIGGNVRIYAPAYQVFSDEIAFITEDSTFEPIIYTTGSPTILWTFANSVTADSANPSVNYHSVGTRVAKLKVSPWSGLIGINLGYNGGDAGTGYTPEEYYHDDQRVSEIINLHLARQSLVRILACGQSWAKAPMRFIDLSNFSSLEVAEFYYNDIRDYSIVGCTALQRLCFEGCGITIADIYDCTALEDFRGALGTYDSIRASSHPNLWHLCIRGNSSLTKIPNINTVFPNVVEVWTHFTGLSGDLGFGANNTLLNDVRINNCNFSQAAVDAMALAVDSLNVDGYRFYVDGSGNAIPSAAGITSLLGLSGDGWTVLYNLPTAATPSADPVAGNYLDTQTVALLCATDGATIYYTTNGTQPTTGSTEYTGEITVGETTRIRAIAAIAGYNNSTEYDGTFTISNQVATPIFTPSGGTYTDTQHVVISSTTGSSTVYYRIDSTSWVEYTDTLVVPDTQVIDAYAIADGMDTSETATETYNVAIDTGSLCRIDFVTDSSFADMLVILDSAEICTVIWHWDGGALDTGLTVYQEFDSVATRNNYVTFSNPSAVIQFGRGATYVTKIYSVDADWTEFPNCDFLYFYNCGLVSMSLVDGVFNQLRLRNNEYNKRTPQAQLDNWLIDLDAESTYGDTPRNIYIENGRSSASNDAKASLITKSWSVTDSD